MGKLSKVTYVILRTFSIFSLPGLRALRNRGYAWNFRAIRMNVSDRVMVVAAHRSNTASIEFGRDVELGAGVYIDYSGGVRIGDRVAVSEGAKIFTHNHAVRVGRVDWHQNPIEFSSLEVENDAWIGASAIVLPRVTRIGRGAIVGAGAVVSEDVGDLEVVAGNPARVVYVRAVAS